MSAVAFDTLKFAKRLKEAGFTESQAEALASAQVDLIEASLATKADILGLTRDIEALRAEVKRDLRDLDHGLRIALAEAKASTIKWVAGLLLAQAAVVATLVKLL